MTRNKKVKIMNTNIIALNLAAKSVGMSYGYYTANLSDADKEKIHQEYLADVKKRKLNSV